MPEEKAKLAEVINNDEYNEDKIERKTFTSKEIQKDASTKKKIILQRKFKNGVVKNSLGAVYKDGQLKYNYGLSKKERGDIK